MEKFTDFSQETTIPFMKQFDVSDIVQLRQNARRVAISLQCIGALFSLYLLLPMISSYMGILAASLLAIAAFGFANSMAIRLRAGSRTALSIAVFWGLLWFGSSFFIMQKYLDNDIYRSISICLIYLPLAYLAWGLLGLALHKPSEFTSANPTELQTCPWEQYLQTYTRPNFLSKKRINAYVFLALTPLPYLWFRGSQLRLSLPGFDISNPEAAAQLTVQLTGSLLFLHVAARIYRHARREAMEQGSSLVENDERSVVLYLRSFHDDSHIRLWARKTNGRSLLEKLVRIPFEEVVTDHLWGYGPVLAIGEPKMNSETALLGAARVYAIDEWQKKAIELMTQSSMIIAVVGQTPGLLWEIETIVSLGLLSKVVLIFPPVSKKKLEKRWQYIESNITALSFLDELDLNRARALIFPDGCSALIYGDKLNDWTYEAVLDQAALVILGTPPSIETKSRIDQFITTIKSETHIFIKLMVKFISIVFLVMLLVAFDYTIKYFTRFDRPFASLTYIRESFISQYVDDCKKIDGSFHALRIHIYCTCKANMLADVINNGEIDALGDPYLSNAETIKFLESFSEKDREAEEACDKKYPGFIGNREQ